MGEYNLSGYNSISSNRFAFYIWISLNILLVGAALRRLNYYLVFFPLLFFSVSFVSFCTMANRTLQ